ncbi:FmdB family zinc ribbon protein [Microbulbifer epialgicus]|uniref:FmdB family zinc ribbon protein n=1 Tax=Microbulbifer epialgicus TaxID=393907 RepID=A0ABV4P0Q6_9GAMM
MPIYEYQCNACGHEMEALQRMSDDPLKDCPACEQAELRKKISAVGFRLKGGGWYETDFKTGNKKNLSGDAANSGKAKDDKPAKAGAKTA